MSEIANALHMLLLLKNRGKMKAAELAEEISVEIKSIRRYRDCLDKAGIFIQSETGKYGGYTLISTFPLSNFSISCNEYLSLMLVSKYLEESRHVAYQDIKRIIEKIRFHKNDEELTSNLTHTHFAKESRSVFNKGKLTHTILLIHEAIISMKKISITYTSLSSGVSTRVVHPYITFQYIGDMYFAGFCELKKEMRDFKIGRISEMKIIGEPFEKLKIDMEDFMKNCIGIYKDEELDVKLKIYPPMSYIVSEKIFIENQKISQLYDETIIFEARMKGLTEIKTWILGMGSKVEVLEPEMLKDEIKKEVEIIKSFYL